MTSDSEWETIDIGRRKKLEQLLQLSKCPNTQCDKNGTCSGIVSGYDGEPDLDIWQCQWCHDRGKVLALGGHQTKVGDTWYIPDGGVS